MNELEQIQAELASQSERIMSVGMRVVTLERQIAELRQQQCTGKLDCSCQHCTEHWSKTPLPRTPQKATEDNPVTVTDIKVEEPSFLLTYRVVDTGTGTGPDSITIYSNHMHEAEDDEGWLYITPENMTRISREWLAYIGADVTQHECAHIHITSGNVSIQCRKPATCFMANPGLSPHWFCDEHKPQPVPAQPDLRNANFSAIHENDGYVLYAGSDSPKRIAVFDDLNMATAFVCAVQQQMEPTVFVDDDERTDYADLCVEMYYALAVIKDTLIFVDEDTRKKLDFEKDIIKGIEKILEKASPILAETGLLDPGPPDTPECAVYVCTNCGEEYDVSLNKCIECGKPICDDCQSALINDCDRILCGDCWHNKYSAEEVQQ